MRAISSETTVYTGQPTLPLRTRRVKMFSLEIGASESESSDASDTDLDVSAEEREALQPASLAERRRRLCSERGLTRSQTIYATECEDATGRPAAAAGLQTRILDGLRQEALSLGGRYLGPASFRPVSLALRVNDNLTKLDFSHNGLDAEGMLYLSKVLKDNTNVRELNLSGNNIGDKGAITVADLMKFNSSIQILDLSDNKIGDAGGKFLALGIEQSDSVRSLNLSRNCLSEMGALYVGRALAENFLLEELDVSWCHVRKVGAVGLCQGVGKNVSLARVSLSWNGLGYEGALALSRLLRTNKYLRELDVANCRINWQGALLLVDGLKANYSLQILRIGGNPLSTTGCMDILEALTCDTSAVSLLDLRGNNVTADFELLSQTISAGRQFQCLHDGVLPSHDLIGRRTEQEKDPMSEVIGYMQRYHLRPLELFRSFDKDVMMQMNKTDFLDRLKRAGISLTQDEMAEIAQQINTAGRQREGQPGAVQLMREQTKSEISYRKFSEGIRRHRRQEREKKMREANAQRRLTVYHKEILSEGAAGGVSVSQELGRLSLTEAFHERGGDGSGGGGGDVASSRPARLAPLQHSGGGSGDKKKLSTAAGWRRKKPTKQKPGGGSKH